MAAAPGLTRSCPHAGRGHHELHAHLRGRALEPRERGFTGCFLIKANRDNLGAKPGISVPTGSGGGPASALSWRRPHGVRAAYPSNSAAPPAPALIG